ncbi:hypothetical protein JOD20_005375, partial [Herpetosiphon giganteus]|nr:hypothetical protein [Herpetosiphon giganteus]
DHHPPPDPPATSRGTVLSGTMVTRVNYLPLKEPPLPLNAGEGEPTLVSQQLRKNHGMKSPAPTETRARGAAVFTDQLRKNHEVKAPRPAAGRGVGVRGSGCLRYELHELHEWSIFIPHPSSFPLATDLFDDIPASP